MKHETKKRPVQDTADREKLAREWADRLPGESGTDEGPVRETYRDGGLISECWADRAGEEK